MAKNLGFIWIGKLKKSFWQEAVQHYWRSLSRYYRLQEVCLKNAPASMGPEQSRQEESKRIQQRLASRDKRIVLDIKGRALSSPELAKMLQLWLQDSERRPCFVLGGSFGLDSAICSRADFLLSLGPITLPHELARVVLLEQLYRASCINLNHPYHH
ncbi:MAG: 23S rRNA (pseudouridine(1915)-N(3))-methyltransferase RlmH [Desulfohalobiaceae bacterium]